MIKTLTKLPAVSLGNWEFRISVSDDTNIMILANNEEYLILRYYIDEEAAKAFILECSNDKHSP